MCDYITDDILHYLDFLNFNFLMHSNNNTTIISSSVARQTSNTMPTVVTALLSLSLSLLPAALTHDNSRLLVGALHTL